MLFKRALMAVAIASAVGLPAAHAQETLLADGVPDITASAESVYFFGPASSSDQRAVQDDLMITALENDPSVMGYEVINVDARLLNGATDSFYLNFAPGLVFPIKKMENYSLNDEYSAWTGELDMGYDARVGKHGINPNQAVFVRSKDNRVFGQIRMEGQVFEVATTEKGNYLLIERDFSQIGYEDDTPAETLPFETTPPLRDFAQTRVDGTTRATSDIRVLQAASPQAISALGGGGPTVDRMNFFLAQSNQVFNNNQLDMRFVDAGKFNSGANERFDAQSNAAGLRSTNDGYLDTFAGATRNSRGADLVGLIVNTPGDPGICGIVNAIGGGQSNGFFVVKHSCTNFTFVHEVGHLFGARHDNDPTTSPFSFGHGFVSASANYRTIMAVSSNPQPRIALFSTDRFSVGGVTAGNASFRDNERVHETRRNTVAGFR